MSGEIGLGWKGPPALDQKADAALDVLSEILDLPRTGRLALAFSSQQTPPNATCRYISEKEGGIFTVLVTANSGFESARQKIIEVIGALANNQPPLPGEIFLAKQRVIGRFLYDTETVGGAARELGISDILAGYQRSLDRVSVVNELTEDDLVQAAQTYLNPAKAVCVELRASGG